MIILVWIFASDVEEFFDEIIQHCYHFFDHFLIDCISIITNEVREVMNNVWLNKLEKVHFDDKFYILFKCDNFEKYFYSKKFDHKDEAFDHFRNFKSTLNENLMQRKKKAWEILKKNWLYDKEKTQKKLIDEKTKTKKEMSQKVMSNEEIFSDFSFSYCASK